MRIMRKNSSFGAGRQLKEEPEDRTSSAKSAQRSKTAPAHTFLLKGTYMGIPVAAS
jgi:hypothetical protein